MLFMPLKTLQGWAMLLAENKHPLLSGVLTFICVKISSLFSFLLAVLSIQWPAELQFLIPVFEYLLSLSSMLFAAALTLIVTHHIKRYLQRRYPIK